MTEISCEKKPLEIYVHVPFCVRKCNYCDFLSMPCDEDTKAAYMEAVLTEIRGKSERYATYRVVSVFIGGGTPSTVKPSYIAQVLEVIYSHFDVSVTAEITMEINPGTVDEASLRLYKQAGVNRLSIGLQSANDKELERLGRIHSYDDFVRAYSFARRVGFCNINVDVMSAIPGQTRESYLETLKRVTGLVPQPEHISAYSLIVEEGTVFYQEELENRLDVPDEDTERLMYEDTKQLLAEHGYHRYEISNYAKEGYECRHNKGYWERTDYVGFGIGSASLIGNERFGNGEQMQEYIKDPLHTEAREALLTEEDEMAECMFLGLRLTAGVRKKHFEDLFGRRIHDVYGAVVEKNCALGLLEETEDVLCLTQRGLDVANRVMADFLL